MDDYHFPNSMTKGDTIVLNRVLPDNLADGTDLSFLIYLSAIDVRVDGKLIYSAGDKAYRNGKMASSYIHYIALNHADSGKEIQIRIRPTETNAFVNIGALRLIPSRDVYLYQLRENAECLAIGLFLTILGWILTIVGGTTAILRRELSNWIMIGLMSSLVGTWTLACSKLLQIFFSAYQFDTVVEYLSLYCAVVPFILLLINRQQEVRKETRRSHIGCKLLYILFFGLIGMIVIAMVLHFTDIVHIPAFLPVLHMFGAASLIVYFGFVYSPNHDQATSDKLFSMAILVLCGFGFMDMIRFNLQKYLLRRDSEIGNTLLQYGVLIMIILMTLSLLLRAYEEIQARAESAVFREMAYHDQLTGLYNRAMCNRICDQQQEHPEHFTTVAFDLNYLKQVNDNHGHEMGDTLIRAFADILQESFGALGQVIRTGGDEFVVFMKAAEKADIEHALSQMSKLAEEASQKYPFQIDCAYGIASSDEVDAVNDPHNVLKLSDQRMYEMKRTAHKSREQL